MIEPSRPAVEGLTKHIKETFRAFPIADLAKMILNARERYQARFTAQDAQKLYRCPADGSLWLSREEAISHLLNSPAIEAYYLAEDVEVGPPSGNFTSVAVCGFSGTLLGPPNHHEYQRNIVRLHQERFSNMPLERFKSRIQMESGEETIERWKEQVSRMRHYRLKSEMPAAEESEREAEEETDTGDLGASVDEPTSDVVSEEEAPADAVANLEDEPVEVPEGEAEALVEEEGPESEDLREEEGNEAETETETETESETPTQLGGGGLVLKSAEELARHFRQHFADEAVQETVEAVVTGNIPGRLLSGGLLAHLRQEGDRLRRGFPLPLMQALCRDLEKEGLRFFKRGKKSLHVSAVRPRALDASVSLTEHVQKIVDFVIASPRATVADMLEALVPGFTRPQAVAPDVVIELSDEAKAVLKDLRWLTAEGYVLEFPDTGLAIGRMPQRAGDSGSAPSGGAVKKAKPAAKKASGKRPASAPPTAPSAEEAEIETSDPILEMDAGDEDPDDGDELPESVNPVETF